MSICEQNTKYRNAKDNGTIHMCKRSDLYIWGWCEPYWEIVFQQDNQAEATVVKTGLKRKPSKKTIQKLIEEL